MISSQTRWPLDQQGGQSYDTYLQKKTNDKKLDSYSFELAVWHIPCFHSFLYLYFQDNFEVFLS